MTLVCPNCQAENLASDRFCRNCGQPMAGAATPAQRPQPPVPTPAPPPTPPTPMAPSPATPAPPPAVPPAAAAPPPSGPPPLTRRLPLGLIIGGVLAVLLLVAGAGAVVALVLGGDDDDPPPPPSLGPATTPTAVPTPTPDAGTPAPTPGPGETPAATPSPTAAPTPEEQTGDFQLIDVENLSLEVPANWEVLVQEPEVILVRDPGSRGLVIDRSWTGESEATLEAFQQAVIAGVREGSPDAEICAGPDPGRVAGLPIEGVVFALCFTLTPEGGEAFPAVARYALAVQGRTRFYDELFAHRDGFNDLVEAWRLIPAPTWKLYAP